MLLLSFIHFFAMVSYAYLIVYLLAHNRRTRINQACISFLLCLSLWSLQFVPIHHPSTDAATARLWMNVGAVGWISMTWAFLWFALLYTGKIDSIVARRYHGLSLILVILLLVMQWRGKIVDRFYPTAYGWAYGYVDSIWVTVYLFYLLGSFGLALFLFYRFARTRNRRVERWQGIKLFAFTGVSVILASALNVFLPLTGITSIPPLGNVTALLWAGWLMYTIVKYKSLTITPVTAADSILATMSDLLILCDPDGIVVTANQATCGRIGGPCDRIKGRPITRFITLQDETFEGIGQRRIDSTRAWLRTVDHQAVPVLLSSSPFRDHFGELAGTVTVAKDISAVLAAEKALHQSEQRYRDLVENIHDVIYAIDPDGTITYLSPRIREMTGHRADELIGRNIIELIYGDDQSDARVWRKKVMSGLTTATRGRLIKKDGRVSWVQASSRPIMDGGRIVGIQGVLTDINDLVLAQQEKNKLETRLHKAQKMEAIGTLAGGVAHDLNNILSGIVSYPDLLLLGLPEDSPLRKPLEVIKGSGEKAATIVQDLLTLARRGVVNMEIIDLNLVVNEFLTSPEHSKQSVHFPAADIRRTLAPELMPVNGSKVHLSKTLMNLMSNAFESLPGGEGRVTVATANIHLDRPLTGHDEMKPGDYVLLQVADTGTGIDPPDMERIFEPFYTKKIMGRSGTGLGMAVVWGTVKDHRGFIDVKSTKGIGTTITLYLPAAHQVPDRVPEDVRCQIPRGKDETILVIDDVAEQRVIASSILSKLGYQVLTADSGKQALAMVESESPDLLLLDMIMDPGWDGLETYEKILKVRPGQKAIIASGFSETNRVQLALRRGAGAYVQKPYTLKAIADALQKVLGEDKK